MSLDAKEADMAASENRRLTARHWVLIAAAAVAVVILLVRSVVDRTGPDNIIAAAAVAVAVTSLLNLRREKAG